MKRKQLDSLNGLVSFFICYVIYKEYVYGKVIYFSGMHEKEGIFIFFLHILVMTGCLFSLVSLTYRRPIQLWQIRSFYFFYSMLLLYLLLFKHSGVQGIGLDLIGYIKETIHGNRIVGALNILAFIPIGLLFKLRFRSIFFFLLCIFLIESAQYVFHLGIFDVGDIVYNTLGFTIGSALYWLVHTKKKRNE